MIKKLVFIIVFFCFAATIHAQDIPKLKMADVVKNFEQKNDSIYVINFWATFCKPCVAEIPNFIKIANKYKKDKVKLMLVSLDLPSFYPNKIAAFATKNNFATNIAWLEETNADYFCPMIDKSWGGSIPATIIVNTKTGYRKFFEAEMKGEDFEKELKKAIDSKKDAAINKFMSPMNEAKINEHNTKLMESDFPSYGITFKADDSTVFSVGEGKVITIVDIEEMKVVIVEKDRLFYIYSNLKSVFVKKGDMIKPDQIIGYAAVDLDGIIPTLDFYLNNEKNPVTLAKNTFRPRKNNVSKDHSFDPTKEPE
jgi:thiol-disulfide isomerase/thioredoxin